MSELLALFAVVRDAREAGDVRADEVLRSAGDAACWPTTLVVTP